MTNTNQTYQSAQSDIRLLWQQAHERKLARRKRNRNRATALVLAGLLLTVAVVLSVWRAI